MAVTGTVAVAAQADSVTVEPTPTLAPTPTPFPSPESIVDHIDVLDLTPTSATLSFGDTVADPLSYLITVSGYPEIPTQREGSTRLTNLTPGTTYNVRVFSRGGFVFFPGFDTFAIQFTTPTVGGPVPSPAGPTPAPSPAPTGTTACNEIGPPTSEVRYRILQVTPTTARIFYHYGAGCFLTPVTGTYEVDGQVRATLTGFSGIYTITGLEPGSTHRVKITGNAGGSNGGPRLLADLNITTPLVTSTPAPTPTLAPSPVAPTPGIDPPIPYSYGLSGSATLKTLTKGSLPLSGSIDAKLTLPGGAFTGDLSLGQSIGNLTALGFLPVTAKVNLVSTDKVTGSLKDGKLTAVAKVRIKLPSVKALGIELPGGANCQAKQISSVTLTSTQAKFMPLSGGPIAGTFSISDLSGCGFLTGVVSPLTQGSGNLIALNLSPRPFPVPTT
jgi:hypothetical protein